MHPEGNVNSLRDAMAGRFDDNYHKLHEDFKVNFTKCYKNGRIEIGAEGPQWTVNGPVAGGQGIAMFNNSITNMDPDEWVMPSNVTCVAKSWVVGDDGEEEGWWDDWE